MLVLYGSRWFHMLRRFLAFSLAVAPVLEKVTSDNPALPSAIASRVKSQRQTVGTGKSLSEEETEKLVNLSSDMELFITIGMCS